MLKSAMCPTEDIEEWWWSWSGSWIEFQTIIPNNSKFAWFQLLGINSSLMIWASPIEIIPRSDIEAEDSPIIFEECRRFSLLRTRNTVWELQRSLSLDYYNSFLNHVSPRLDRQWVTAAISTCLWRKVFCLFCCTLCSSDHV